MVGAAARSSSRETWEAALAEARSPGPAHPKRLNARSIARGFPGRPLIRIFFSHALHRRLLIWLLAVALPVQAAVCATLAVRGPAHVHQWTAGAVALEDFRRAPPHGVFLDRRAVPAVGHVHAFDLPQRHPHARFDPSVVKTGAADAADADESVAPTSPAAAFVALLPAPPSWQAGPRASFPATGRNARFSSLPPAPPEKPPRAVL